MSDDELQRSADDDGPQDAASCIQNGLAGPALAERYTNRCYVGGHFTYRGRPSTRLAMLKDLKQFMTEGRRR